MKPLLAFLITISTAALIGSCTDSGTDPGERPNYLQLGTVRLNFAAAPPEITHVVATLSRPGYSTRTMHLTISGTNTATGSFTSVPNGQWHLLVEAFDSTNTVRYAGETNVAVLPGQTTIVNLQLLPATGSIHITVTWGTTPTHGLVAYYPFSGNAQDASGNGNHGVVHGAILTADRHGNPNSAYWFNGIDNRIEIASSPTLNPVNQLTVALWLRVDSITDNRSPVIHKGGPVIPNPWLANREYHIEMKRHIEPVFYFQMNSAGNGAGQHQVTDSQGASTGQWIFIATVVDRVNHVMRFYMNGVLSGQVYDSYSTFNNNSYPITLAMEAETGWPDHSPFKGAMDELRIYNRALTGAEIQGLYQLD